MKNVFFALCWLASLGVLGLHAESFDNQRMSDSDPQTSALAAAALHGHYLPGSGPATEQPRRFIAIHFNEPRHPSGQAPVTGIGHWLPAGLSGNPQVVMATPALPHQPLLLNTDLANGPCCYEEGIQLLLPKDAGRLVLSFDLASHQLGDSLNQFQLRLNGDTQPLLRLQPDYQLVLDAVGTLFHFRDDHLLHIQLDMDPQAQWLNLSVNGQLLYSGERALPPLHSLQFLLAAEDGIQPEQVNPAAHVALDNIVVANGSYRYANLQTDIRHLGNSRASDDSHGWLTQVRNISGHAAENVVLTQLLPPGSRIVRMDSADWDCTVADDQVRCQREQLDAMGQATVMLWLATADPAQPAEISASATSAIDDADNSDNSTRSRYAGNSSLLLLAALLLLWVAREWVD